jgi:hypothetical protein
MNKDYRYSIVKDYYEAGRITEFKQIFTYIPKSVVAEDIRTSTKRMTLLMEEPHTFKTEEVYLMSQLFEIPFEKFLMLTLKDFIRDKSSLPPR